MGTRSTEVVEQRFRPPQDPESTRLNSSHANNSYAALFFNDTATTEIYTLSLHDALPIYNRRRLSDVLRTCRRPNSRSRRWMARRVLRRWQSRLRDPVSYSRAHGDALIGARRAALSPPARSGKHTS